MPTPPKCSQNRERRPARVIPAPRPRRGPSPDAMPRVPPDGGGDGGLGEDVVVLRNPDGSLSTIDQDPWNENWRRILARRRRIARDADISDLVTRREPRQ